MAPFMTTCNDNNVWNFSGTYLLYGASTCPWMFNGDYNLATGEPLGTFHSANFSFGGDGTVQFQLAIVIKT
jgi:hypothetical protein